MYRRTDRYAQAEQASLRCLKIIEARQGKDHPDVARILGNLAELYVSTGEPAKAWPVATRASDIMLGSRFRLGTTPLARSAFFGESGLGDFLPCLALKLRKKVDILQRVEKHHGSDCAVVDSDLKK